MVIVGSLTIFLLAITAYSSIILNSQVLYTHLFYYPIAIAVFWWGRKGSVVSILLVFSLLFFEIASYAKTTRLFDAILRSMTFLFFTIVLIGLVETKQQKEKLEILRNELEFLNDLLFHDIRNYNLITNGYLQILESKTKEEENKNLIKKSRS